MGKSAREALFPEVAAGGFARTDATIEFFLRIHSLVDPSMVVLDFGAGRGRAIQEDPLPWRRQLRSFRGKCAKFVGIDLDPAVLENPSLDEAYVMQPGEAYPLASSSIDIAICDCTLEHVDNPEFTASELHRVLKPGGWFCARTPNRWGYIGIGANLIPNRWHVPLLRVLQPGRKDIDVFPTIYKMNTRRRLKKFFPESAWKHIVYGYFPEPAYCGNSRLLWTLMTWSTRFTPEAMAPIWLIFLRKREV